jgi:hypothetical protein
MTERDKPRRMLTAPRDGTKFLAFCEETGARGFDIAWWSGKTPDDLIGRFTTSYGWRPVCWWPLPNAPSVEQITEQL